MNDVPNTVPVTIVTGFLGSGKTTMLNRLLKRPALADTVVIVNEFGEVGLDHLLIEQAIENTVLLKNGCICCTVRGDVADTLEGLWQQRAAGAIPPFSRIVIETTGLADPGSVAHALIAEPGAGYACRLDGIVTTLDALHGRQQMHDREEVQRQVSLADVVLLTKDRPGDPARCRRRRTGGDGMEPGGANRADPRRRCGGRCDLRLDPGGGSAGGADGCLAQPRGFACARAFPPPSRNCLRAADARPARGVAGAIPLAGVPAVAARQPGDADQRACRCRRRGRSPSCCRPSITLFIPPRGFRPGRPGTAAPSWSSSTRGCQRRGYGRVSRRR